MFLMISRKIYMPKSNNTCYPAKYEKFVNLYQDKHVKIHIARSF